MKVFLHFVIIFILGSNLYSQNVTKKSFQLAAEYNTECDGVSLLVMKNGEILFENYPNKYHVNSKDSAYPLYSGGKSFWGVVASKMIMDGLLTSFDELASETITEWKNDTNKSKITIRHLLNFTSGIDANFKGDSGKTPSPLLPGSQAILSPSKYEPGEKFEYGQTHIQCFGEIIRRKLIAKGLGSDPVNDYLFPKILEPIGALPKKWAKLSNGESQLPSGAEFTAKNWVKFGKLINQNGIWNGDTIINPTILQECFIGSTAYKIFGLSWWLDSYTKTFPQTVSAVGALGQYLIISRNSDIVIVRQSSKATDSVSSARKNSFKMDTLLTLLFSGIPDDENNEITWFKFKKDYFPGTLDINGNYMGGTEAMALAGFHGKLYAAIGFAMDVPSNEPKLGAQILVKETKNSNWKVEKQFDTTNLRIETIKKISIEKDINGNMINPPKEFLAAGPSGLYTPVMPWTSIWLKTENSEEWTESQIIKRYLGIRSFQVFTDKVTGLQHLFAGLNVGAIYKGSYESGNSNIFKWNDKPELIGVGRIMSFCECNGTLYASTNIEDTTKPLKGGIYKRIDGDNPKWEKIYEVPYYDPKIGQSGFIRGLTCVPNPINQNDSVIIAALEYKGLIIRIDPDNNNQSAIEIDLMKYLNEQWNDSLLNKNGVGGVYNRFTSYFDPVSMSNVWLAGIWAHKIGYPGIDKNGSYFIQRDETGKYKWCYIYDYDNPIPVDKTLTGTRDIEISPFPEDNGNVLYFCGFDAGYGPSHNTAWIYKGTINGTTSVDDFHNFNENEFFLSPNPASVYIEINLDKVILSEAKNPVKIYNTFGECVMTIPDVPHLADVAHLKRIDISHLPVGIYFIKIGNYTKKFMVVR
jgi:CubicO group peptidase (beta-lactamase class C family)